MHQARSIPRRESGSTRPHPMLAGLIRKALARPVPERIRSGGFMAAHAYVELAAELQAYLQGKRPEVLAAEALRRFEGMQA